MKKLKYFIMTLLLAFCILPNSVLAAGSVSVSTTKLTVQKGSSTAFKISANNAAGRVDITSSNPNVASVSNSSLFLDMQSGTITVKGNSAGTATITVVVTDATTYDDEDLSGRKYTITVTVTEPKPSNSNTNSNKPSNTNTNKPTNSNSNTNNNLSKNNNLKELSIEGYSVNKIDNNHYSLTVGNNVTNINIKATAEDSKATIKGNGKKDLKIGDNNFEVVVISESGAQNKINVKITRKEDSSLEDLDSLLNDSKIEEINITIADDTIIPAAIIQKIKDKKKTVNFNYYDENKKLKYTWIVIGNKVGEPRDVLTTISYNPENKKEISKASNYAEGIFVNFKHKDDIPRGIKVKLSVEDKFEDGYVLRLYQYEEGKLNSIREDLNVKTGTIEFEVEKGDDYFITMSSIKSRNEKRDEQEASNLNIFMIISIIEFIVIIILMIMISKKNNKKDSKNMDDDAKTNFPVSSEKSSQERNTIDSVFKDVSEDIDLEEESSIDDFEK